jgi:hypothetical protein
MHPPVLLPDDADELGPATRGLLLALVLEAAWIALCAGVRPDLVAWALPWPAGLRAPLHARCLAALHTATALTWLLALRERDAAAIRIPLALALAGSVGAVLAMLGPAWAAAVGSAPAALAPGAAGWLALHLALGLWAAWRLRQRRELRAPAERLDRASASAAAMALAAAGLLALAPAWAARWWPWPLPLALAAPYASVAAAWAVALGMLARERRHAARRLALVGLLAMGPLVALVTAVHADAFRPALAALVWPLPFLALSALAWRRLRTFRPARPSAPPAARRTRPARP